MRQVIKVMLVGRHRIMTDGLEALFDKVSEFKVVGRSDDGPAAKDAIGRLQPNVAVVDLILQCMNGLAVIKELKRSAPGTAIVALSMCTDVPYVSQALIYGVSAYVLKSDGFVNLARAVREVTAGREYLSGTLDDRAVQECRRKSRGEPVDKFHALTQREREVLQLAAEGRTSTQIAARLGISRRTAETHRSNIYRKLQIQSQGDLITLALRRGLITRDM